MRSFASRYGASPLHFVGHVALIALTVWSVLNVLKFPGWVDWLLWFAGAAVLHDLVVLPLYTGLDRLLQRTGGRVRRRPLTNYVRVPVVLAASLLLVSFPLVLDRAPGNFQRVAGFAPSGYLGWWLALSLAAVVVSGLWYVVGLVRVDRRGADDLDRTA
jgi:hypothetical protein